MLKLETPPIRERFQRSQPAPTGEGRRGGIDTSEMMNRIYGHRFRPSTPGKFERGSIVSIEALNWAFALEIRDMRIKGVLIALANHLNEHTSVCCPSLKRIAISAGCSEQTVRRTLKRLGEMGLISSIERDAGRSSNYELNFWWEPEAESGSAESVGNPVDKESPETDTPSSLDLGPVPNQVETPSSPISTPYSAVTLTLKPSENLSENHGFGSPQHRPTWAGLKAILGGLLSIPRGVTT